MPFVTCYRGRCRLRNIGRSLLCRKAGRMERGDQQARRGADALGNVMLQRAPLENWTQRRAKTTTLSGDPRIWLLRSGVDGPERFDPFITAANGLEGALFLLGRQPDAALQRGISDVDEMPGLLIGPLGAPLAAATKVSMMAPGTGLGSKSLPARSLATHARKAFAAAATSSSSRVRLVGICRAA